MGLETTGVSIEGVTGLDDLVFLCEGGEEVSDPISKGFKFSEDDCLSATLVEDDDWRCAPRNNKYPPISFFLILFERISQN